MAKKRASSSKKSNSREKNIEHIDNLGVKGIEVAENLRREGYTLMEIKIILSMASSVVAFEQSRAYNSYWDKKELKALEEEDALRAAANKEPMSQEEMQKVMRRIHTGFF